MAINTSQTDINTIVLRPIPAQEQAHTRKADYRRYPLLTDHPQNSMPLVDITDYGIAGQSYYSRPNSATGPLAEVASTVYLRRDVAKRLAAINHALTLWEDADVFFGGRVELFIQEGLRSQTTQALLYSTVFPRIIREQQPQMTEQEILARREQLIAAAQPPDTPSPHATGAAFDVTLRYVDADLGYKLKNIIDMGHARISDHTAFPDFYEHTAKKLTAHEQKAARHRRAFYWIMRGALLPGGVSGFVCNPTEWWHWSYGDQMWAALTEAPYAFYGAVEAPRAATPQS